MLEFPKAQGFLYCITLRFGVYIICLTDIASSVFQGIAFGCILASPNLIDPAAESDVLWSGQHSIPGVRAHLFLALVTIVVAYIGALGSRNGYAGQVQAYLTWKIIDTLAIVSINCFLSEIWWSGCGDLPQDVCHDRRMRTIGVGLIGAVPSLYFIWVTWSLLAVLLYGNDRDFLRAGYDEWDLQARRAEIVSGDPVRVDPAGDCQHYYQQPPSRV